MFTPMGFNTADFNKCKSGSFISFIFSFLNIDLFHCVFDKNRFPGICGII